MIYAKTNDFLGKCFSQYFVWFLLIALVSSCESSQFNQSAQQFKRVGESMVVSFSGESISNAIVAWSKTLTNGYVLYDDKDSRLYHMSLTNDPATLFLMQNGTNAIGFWGSSKCLPVENASFWAEIIIRIQRASVGNQISVAIHARHFEKGLSWNLHNFNFDSNREVTLRACPQDELEVLAEIKSVLINLRTNK